jgi:hypothetical protein
MTDEPVSGQLTGVAGVHFVAAYLSFLGFHAVPTTRNVRGPDLLVSSIDGFRSLTLQVKTTMWASRDRGRGELKKLHHLEWDVGWSSARLNNPNLWFAFVDLKAFEELPDTYIIPSKVVFAYFEGGDPTTWIRARYHPLIEEVAPFKNGWDQLKKALINGTSETAIAQQGTGADAQ